MQKNNTKLMVIAGILMIAAVVAVAGCTGSNSSNNPTPTVGSATTTTTGSASPTATASMTTVATGGSTSLTPGFTTLNIGAVPSENAAEVTAEYTPLCNYIHNVTGWTVNLYVATDYTGVVTAMASKKIDVGFFGPLSYCMANEQAGAQAFAMGLGTNNSTVYYSYTVATPAVAKALGITTPLQGQAGMNQLKTLLDAHKGQYTYTFTDPASTSGYGIPRAAMAVAGFDPNTEFKQVGFVGSHDASLLGVIKGTADMGSVASDTYNKYVANGNVTGSNVYIIWKSDPIPESPAAYRGDLPQSVKNEIQNVILNAPPSIIEATGASNYMATNDSAYSQVYALENALNNIST